MQKITILEEEEKNYTDPMDAFKNFLQGPKKNGLTRHSDVTPENLIPSLSPTAVVQGAGKFGQRKLEVRHPAQVAHAGMTKLTVNIEAVKAPGRDGTSHSLWSNLDKAALLGVFAQLDSKDLSAATMVCRAWADVASADCLWQRLLEAEVQCVPFKIRTLLCT